MDITPLIRPGQQVIQSYSGGKFRVSGRVYETAIIVTQDEVFLWDAVAAMDELNAGHFDFLAGMKESLDVVLLGTGGTMQMLKPDFRIVLKGMGLAVESMDTGAACRTYNVLMAEGRRVAAALLPV